MLAGDFSTVAGQRFDRIVFNAPFHDGVPKRDDERAYLGGAGSVFGVPKGITRPSERGRFCLRHFTSNRVGAVRRFFVTVLR